MIENPFNKNGQKLLTFLVDKKKENSIHSYISIRNALYLFAIPCGKITIPAGTALFRCRWHDRSDQFFTKISEISYRKDVNNIMSFGRTNEPIQSIFYCATQRETALFEVSKIQAEKGNLEVEEVTYGKWILQDDLICAHLPLIKKNIGKNPIADYLHKSFEENVNRYLSDESNEWRNLIDLFAVEFSRETYDNEQDYFISCAFSQYLFSTPFNDLINEEELYLNAILYPSVKYTELGLNVAILPEVIIKGDLVLDQVVRQKMEKIGTNSYQETDTHISQRIDEKNDEIVW